MLTTPIITLTTDFGGSGPYVGAMRGVLLGRCPAARLVDVTHEVPPHDVFSGAFVLAAAAPWFPDGTIHLAVVDPGVGGPRRALVVEAGSHISVGPDNGLCTAIYDREPAADVRAIEASRLGLAEAHPTFHGRDLFAPVAAALASGLEPAAIGERVGDPVRGWASAPRRAAADGTLELRVLFVDRFGNVTTDLTPAALADAGGDFSGRGVSLVCAGRADVRARLVATYAEAEGDELLALWGSSGHLELAVDRGRADLRIGVAAGDVIRLRPDRP